MEHWRNRIVGFGEEDPQQLQANPWNWRIHPQKQQDALLDILDRIGWAGPPVIVNRRTGHVVDGHLRILLAMRRGEKKVPVQYVDLDEEEEKIILATLDPISAMAAADEQVLADLLAQIEAEDEQIAALLQQVAENYRVDFEPPDEFPAVDEDVAEEVEMVTCPQCGYRFPK